MTSQSDSIDNGSLQTHSNQQHLQRLVLSLRQQNDKLRRENEALRQDLNRARQIILRLQLMVRRYI